MEMRDFLIGGFIVLILFTGCTDGGNPLSTGPKEVSVDLSTPEGVIEAYWKYIDVGKYDEVYDLFCDDSYFDQIKGGGASKNYYSKESFMDHMVSAYGEQGEKLDASSPKITGKNLLSSRRASIYGIGTAAEEGYGIGCEAGKVLASSPSGRRGWVDIRGGGIVVKHNGRWCIASE